MINLVALGSSKGDNPIIIDGGGLLSINKYFNRKIDKEKSTIMTEFNMYTNEIIQELYSKKTEKIKDYFHKIAKGIITYMIEHKLETIVLGYNTGWKQV